MVTMTTITVAPTKKETFGPIPEDIEGSGKKDFIADYFPAEVT